MILHNDIRLLALFFMLFTLLGCDEKQPMPVDLVFGLKSYSSIDDVKSRVMGEGGAWDVIENNALNTSDVRPQYEYVRVKTNVFSDAGYRGKTLLLFYNGKLMSVWFYANEWDDYKKYLEEKRSVVINDNIWEKISDGVRSWIAMDHETKYYIAWEDIVLANSMKKWIEKYS